MRVRALLAKELLDLTRNRGALVPVALVTAVSLVVPLIVIVMIPAMTGRPLAEDSGLADAASLLGIQTALSDETRVQLFLFQQFLLLFLVTPITGAMSLAAHAVVGEKQGRTLEPLLATPITTFELLVAKVLGALIPTLAISILGMALYFAAIAAFAEPGVFAHMFGARTILLILVVGPAAALVSLQAAIIISSRVNDPRTAQQFGVLIILPLTAVFVAQFTGSWWLSTSWLLLISLGLVVAWALLVLFSVALFDRETILTRWR
jgi:ABC-2 type transport system permease protein